jgi:hypothetical protein
VSFRTGVWAIAVETLPSVIAMAAPMARVVEKRRVITSSSTPTSWSSFP